MKLDMSKFKKGDSDEHYTTLHHSDGHALKIAHKGLSKAMRKELDRIPMADGGQTQAPPLDPEKVKQFTQGFGGTPKERDSSDTPSTPVLGSGRQAYASGDIVIPFKSEGMSPLATEAQAVAQAPQLPPDVSAGQPGGLMGVLDDMHQGLQQAAPDTTYKGEASDPDTVPAATEPPAPVQDAQTPPETPKTKTAQPSTPTKPTAPAATPKEQALQESANFDHDLMKGHITPETYQSLFHKKDTLGKIGTLFGLLVAGAGSGLAHQQNAVLGMMDKQIENDLQGQIHSATNAQNFYKLTLQHELQSAQIPQMKALTAAIPSEIKLRQAQTAEANARAKAQMYSNLATVQALSTLVDRMPPAMQAKARAVLGIIKEKTLQKNDQLSNQVQDSSSILTPQAGDFVNAAAAAQTGPLANQYPELSKEYNSARQAEKGLKTIDEVFPKLTKEANFAQYLGNAMPAFLKHGSAAIGIEHGLKGIGQVAKSAGVAAAAEPLAGILGAAGLIGAGAKAAGFETNPLKWDATQKTRLYQAHKNALVGALSSALAGTNVGGQQIEQIAADATPQLEDSPQTIREKQLMLKHFVRVHANLGALDRNKLLTPEE